MLRRGCCGSSEQSEISEHSDGLADARTMVCRSWLTAYPPGGDGALCGAGQPATASGVAEMSAFCHHHRLLSSSPPAAVGMRYIASAQSNANSANTMDDKSTQPAAVGRDTYIFISIQISKSGTRTVWVQSQLVVMHGCGILKVCGFDIFGKNGWGGGKKKSCKSGIYRTWRRGRDSNSW